MEVGKQRIHVTSGSPCVSVRTVFYIYYDIDFLKNTWTYSTPIILQYNFYVFPSKRKSSCLLKSQSVLSRLNSQLRSKELFAFIMFPTKYTHFLFQFSHLANASIFSLHVTVQIFIKILFCQWLKIFLVCWSTFLFLLFQITI